MDQAFPSLGWALGPTGFRCFKEGLERTLDPVVRSGARVCGPSTPVLASEIITSFPNGQRGL